MPFRGELITWAANHQKAGNALLVKLLGVFEGREQATDTEVSRLLEDLRVSSYAVGALHADLAAERFR